MPARRCGTCSPRPSNTRHVPTERLASRAISETDPIALKERRCRPRCRRHPPSCRAWSRPSTTGPKASCRCCAPWSPAASDHRSGHAGGPADWRQSGTRSSRSAPGRLKPAAPSRSCPYSPAPTPGSCWPTSTGSPSPKQAAHPLMPPRHHRQPQRPGQPAHGTHHRRRPEPSTGDPQAPNQGSNR
jgi:hypothetical protein